MNPNKVCSDPRELLPDLQTKIRQLLNLANHDSRNPGTAAHPEGTPKFPGFIHWEIFETYRPQERQDLLYAQGRTAPGDIVTWRKTSLHTQRVACDLVWIDTDGKARWDGPIQLWAILGHCARAVGLVWGGDWKNSPDTSHVQLPNF